MKKNVLVQSKSKSGGKGEEPKTLGGIWKDKGFEKIKNLDEEIKKIRKEWGDQILKKF